MKECFDEDKQGLKSNSNKIFAKFAMFYKEHTQMLETGSTCKRGQQNRIANIKPHLHNRKLECSVKECFDEDKQGLKSKSNKIFAKFTKNIHKINAESLTYTKNSI